MFDTNESLDREERPSKSQKKRDSAEIMKFALQLSQLTPKQIARLSLPEDVHNELLIAVSIKSFSARKRQVKTVGGIIRKSGCYQEVHQKYLQAFKGK